MESSIQGIVTKYKGNGRKLGYPTANIAVKSNNKDGVYFGYAGLGKYINSPSLVFIGVPKTIGDTDNRVEVHILDIPDIDYYGETLTIRITHFYRDNKKFESIEQLVTAMKQDEKAARGWFLENKDKSK